MKEWSQSDLIDSTQDTESDEVVTWTYPNWSAGEPIYCRQYTYNQKGQYQTMLQGAVASTEDAPAYSPILSENTWTQIAQAVADKDPILDVWQVGDTKDETIAGETLTFAIMGKNMDDLADGSGKAGLTFGMTQLMASTRQMNSSNTNSGSFAGSAMYSWLSGTIYPNLPAELKDAIKAVTRKPLLVAVRRVFGLTRCISGFSRRLRSLEKRHTPMRVKAHSIRTSLLRLKELRDVVMVRVQRITGWSVRLVGTTAMTSVVSTIRDQRITTTPTFLLAFVSASASDKEG